MSKAATLTAERLRELLSYDPETGVFTTRYPTRQRPAGAVKGSRLKSGRTGITVDGVLHLAYRLAWLYMTGNHPAATIDHIDGDKSNDRWANLRDVVRRTNNENRRSPRKDNKLGVQGVVRYGNRFLAYVGAGGKTIYLGSFDTPEMASGAYVEAKRQLHAGCTL